MEQMLTLFITPVVYLYMDRLRLYFGRRKEKLVPTKRAPEMA